MSRPIQWQVSPCHSKNLRYIGQTVSDDGTVTDASLKNHTIDDFPLWSRFFLILEQRLWYFVSVPNPFPFPSSAPVCALGHLPPGEGILTPNPPAQNRRPVINVICNSTHVTIPDINITWESNPTHGPARCQYYVPICSGTGSVTPAFCAAKKSIFNFQPQSRAAPCISPAAPSEIKWTARPGGRALQSVS